MQRMRDCEKKWLISFLISHLGEEQMKKLF